MIDKIKALPQLKREHFVDKKLIGEEENGSIYEFDEEYALIFDIDSNKKYTLSRVKRDIGWDQTAYIYCGKLYSEGKLCGVYKSKKVKGYLGYIKIDIIEKEETITSEGVKPFKIIYGILMQGLVLVNKEKYFLYNGEIWSWNRPENGFRRTTGSRKGIYSWGEVV